MPFLKELYREWPFFRTLLSNMDMVLAKSSIAIASRYAELVPDVALREKIFGRIRRNGTARSRRCWRSWGRSGCWRAIRCWNARSATAFRIWIR